VLLDSGNISDNPSPSGDIKTRALVQGMGLLGYKAANVGLRDMNMGYDPFAARIEGAAFPFISSNIVRKDNGEPVFKPYTIIDTKDRQGRSVRLGVLGVVRYNPVFLKAGPDGSSMVIRRPEQMLEKYLPEVREKADVIVLLAALHKADAKRITAMIEGIDVVLGSYGGAFSIRDEQSDGAWLFYTGNQGKRMGETRLYFNDDGELQDPISYMHFLTARYPGQEKMQEFVNGITKELNTSRAAAQGGAAAAAGSH
jgi:5'-nucleotidase/UDP-sugar diphosphatase